MQALDHQPPWLNWAPVSTKPRPGLCAPRRCFSSPLLRNAATFAAESIIVIVAIVTAAILRTVLLEHELVVFLFLRRGQVCAFIPQSSLCGRQVIFIHKSFCRQ